MRRHLSLVLALGLSAGGLAMVGCDDGDDPVDAGDGDAGSGDVDAGPDTDSGMPGSDGNDTFADADPVTLDEMTGARINPAGDVDFFTFEGMADQWIVMTAVADTTVDPFLDTVITLYDSSMTRIAENDDRVPRADTNSEIIIRLPTTGTYYVEVQEFSTWDRNMQDPMPAAEGSLTYTYELFVGVLNDELAAVNIDAEPNNDAAMAQNLGRNGTFGLMAGTWDASDVDVFSFVMGANPNPNFIVMPLGEDGYGGPSFPTSIWVTNEDGSDTIARITPQGDGSFEFDPSLPLGRYNVHIEGAQGDWYVVKSFIGGDNPPEMAEATNGDPTTPEMVEFTPLEEMMQIERGFVLADLPMGDTDYFAITAAAGDQISATCGSRTSGSGIMDLQVDITMPDGTPISGASATETETMNAFVDGFMPPSPGDYRVRLTRGAQIAGVSGTWVRCGFTVGPPAM